MKLWILAAVLIAAASTRAAADRCDDGAAALAKKDLSRAALYLDGCEDAQPRVVKELRKQLEASNLSVVQIVSNPEGMDAEIDALPGEKLTTPATVYVPAGKHSVRAGALTNTVETKAHARSVVILDAGGDKPAPAPKDGVADFRDDAPSDTGDVGPPPEVKHRQMLPCKYTGTCTEAGDEIADPLALRAGRPPELARWSLELRAGGAYANALGTSVATEVRSALIGGTHPWLVSARGDWRRIAGESSYGGAMTAGKVLAAPDTAWLAAGVGVAYHSREGAAGVALLDLALRQLPVAIGARYEQGGDHGAFVLELGYGVRL